MYDRQQIKLCDLSDWAAGANKIQSKNGYGLLLK